MAQSNETAGYYIKKVKWNDPRFAPHDIRNLGELNDAQNAAFLDLDNDEDFGPDELTKEELIAACKQSECRVDLSRANVCKGVERSWPKRLFGVNHFDQLNSKQKKVINKTMEKYGTKLHTKYVDENRMAERREHARRNSHAYIYEQRYRKNLYNRIKALGEPNATQTSHETDSMLFASMETVINTGKVASQNSSDDTDENDNEYFTGNVVGDLNVAANEDYENDENDANVENITVSSKSANQRKLLPKRAKTSNRRDTSTAYGETTVIKTTTVEVIESIEILDQIDIDASSNVQATQRYADPLSDSEDRTTTEVDSKHGSDDRLTCATPALDVEHGVEPGTPNFNAMQQDAFEVLEVYDSDASEEDIQPLSGDFGSQRMMRVPSSTQQ